MTKVQSIDEFKANYPNDIQGKLETIRQTVKKAVPLSEEAISYGIPTFKLNGKNLLHFGVGKNHIGLYATPDGHASFTAELSKYKQGKGSVQFPLDQPLPLELIERIALYRAEKLST